LQRVQVAVPLWWYIWVDWKYSQETGAEENVKLEQARMSTRRTRREMTAETSLERCTKNDSIAYKFYN
jgi:hypothetical protein